MKIFVTGGTGTLGEHLVPELVKDNYHLILLTRQKKHVSLEHIEYVTGDLEVPGSYEYALGDIDLILHMAAVTHTNTSNLYYRVNTEGTVHLIKLAEQWNVKRFIFLSSRAISDNGGDYCVSKRMAEDVIMSSPLNWIILRPSEIYGVSKGEAITKLIELIGKFPIIPIIGNGAYKLAPVHINDVVSAIMTVIKEDKGKGKIYNLSGPEEMTYKKLLKIIEKKKNVRRMYINIPIFLVRALAGLIDISGLKRPILVKDQIPRLLCEKSADISSARNELGYNPRRIEQFLSSQ